MSRRAFTAPPDDQRCVWDITLRGDNSGARCMRRKAVGDLCTQHAKMDAQLRESMAECCGGNDEHPPGHCADCELPPRSGEESAHVAGSEEQEGVRFTSWCDTHSRATPCDKCAADDVKGGGDGRS